MQGDLAKANVAELLLELYLSKRTGILRLTQADVKKGVYFKDGAVVFAHSNLKPDRLGETLLRLGKITEEEFQIASKEVIEKGKRLGRALWEKGFLSIAEVNDGVSYQLQQIVYSVFNWDSGEYEFVDRERPVYEDIMVDVSTPDLLINGIRHVTNPIVLQRALGDDDQRVVETNEGVRRLLRPTLDFTEETILGCIDAKTTIGRLKTLSQLSEQEFGRAMYSLTLSGIVRIRKSTPEETEEIQSQEPRKRPSLTTRPMKPWKPGDSIPRLGAQMQTFSEEEMRRMILDTELNFRDMTEEEILGVLPDCTEEEIEHACNRLIAIFQPPFYSEDRYHDLKEKLKYICDRIASARERLLEKVASRLPLSEALHAEAGSSFTDSGPEIIRHPYMEVSSPYRPVPGHSASEGLKSEDQKELSLSELEDRVKKEPANAAVLRLLGKKLQETGRAREGERHLLRALELRPQHVENHFALAEFYQAQGLKIKAFKHVNIVLQLEPDNARALKMLSVKKRKKALYEISADQE